MDVAMSFLMLASDMMRAVLDDKELRRTMLSSSCAQMWSFFSFLVAKFKKKQSGKMSMMREPGENS